MDEQRLERALRQGPGFATRYVARPPVLDESLVAQHSAGLSRASLLIAVTALLVGLVAGAIAVGSGLVKLPVIVPVPSPAPLVRASPTPDATEAGRPSGVVAYSVCTRLDPEDQSSCTGDWRIWVVNDDGTGAHELRPDEAGSQYPIAWSPDGSELLYSSDAWGDDLAMTDAAGSAPEVLPNESLCPVEAQDCYASLSSIAFSPDGARVAYAIFTDINPSGPVLAGTAAAGWWTAPSPSVKSRRARSPGSMRRRYRRAQVLLMATTCRPGRRDDTKLAFAMPPLTSFTINVDGSDLRRVVPVGEGESGTAASLVSGRFGNRFISGWRWSAIYVVQPDGGDLRTVDQGSPTSPNWTRDGRIVFCA